MDFDYLYPTYNIEKHGTVQNLLSGLHVCTYVMI